MTAINERKKAAAGDALRVRLLTFIQGAERTDWTAKDLAAALGVPANGLYYHLRILEEASFVAVTGSRVVGRLAERTYGPVAPEEMRVEWDLSQPHELVPYFNGLLDLAKADVQAALFDAAHHYEETGEKAWWRASVLKRSIVTSPVQVREFSDRLHALFSEFQERGEGTKETEGSVRLSVTCAFGQNAMPHPALRG